MSGKVLILGGSGFIGRRLAQRLLAGGALQPVVASRHAGLRLDVTDAPALAAALRGMDAVVNAVAGSERAIAQGAQALAQAVQSLTEGARGVRGAEGAPGLRVIHISSMAVLGEREGRLDETAAPGPTRAWYARAKQQAEACMAGLARAGTPVAVLRPGCVWGPGSTLWVSRVARWLQDGRLGDLGENGDGWTNGVHVDDVCQAIEALLAAPSWSPGIGLFHLAAPDSPRWNAYFRDMALALGATPLRRIAPLRLRLDAWLAGPPLHVAGRLLSRGADGADPPTHLPPPLSPGLLRLFARQQRLVSERATSQLGLRWTPYATALHQGLAALESRGSRSALARNTGLPIT